jgi:hypothetical protein
VDAGGGHYALTYTPSAAGHDYLEIAYGAASFFQTSSEDVISAQTLLGGSLTRTLTQDTPTTGALKVTIDDPSSSTLYVYLSSDWQIGNTETYAAVGSTQLDGSGNWLTTPLYVSPGTYHVIVRDPSGAVYVIQAFLQV